MLNRETFTGPWAGVPVAWTDDDRFDETTYRTDVARCCEAGVPGVYTAGTTGEFYAMEFDEWKAVTLATVKECQAHDTPAMIGCTSTYTLGVERRAAYAAEVGADAIQVALPFWMEIGDEQIVPFFKSVAAASGGLPLSIYETMRTKKVLTHDAVPAASPAEAPVRIMNLHQAKGLEAPVVFLADPTGAYSHEPQIHIDRNSAMPRGYLAIYGPSNSFHRPLLACPEQWEGFAEEEGKFLKAEKDRLLYVAATRAGDRLVVTQREEGNRWNPWSPLKDHLDGCEEMAVPKVTAPPKTKGIVVGDGDPAEASVVIGERWRGTLVRSYDLVAAKAISVSGLAPGATTGEHGTEWGTVVHSLLEAAMRDPGADLRDLAYAGLQHEGLDPTRADEAIAVVRSVTASQVWKRAQAGDRRLMEVPFQTLMLAGSPESSSMRTVLRGVIDLAFHEPKGWVIVDYKTDARPMGHVPALVDHYRGQVETYAKAWREMTGESVVEKGLYFTHADVYASV
jgi:ATP-dependent exoDNAse (exonuclease V) beta subunit